MRHKRLILSLMGLLLIQCPINAQKKGNRFMPIEQLWSIVKLADSTEKPVVRDTMVVMYTNRVLIDSSKYFFSHEIDHERPMLPLLATCLNQQWTVFRMPSIDSAMQFLPSDRALVIYVEGLGKNFPIAMYRAAGMTTQYQVNVLMYDYPTLNERYDLIRNYYFAERNSKNNSEGYKDFLLQLIQYKADNRSWISGKSTTVFHHSLGNAMLKEGVKEGYFDHLPDSAFDRLVLNAACVPQWNHRKWINKLSYAKEIYIHYNKGDFELLGATLLKHRYILGSRPIKRTSHAVYIDFNPLLDRKHNGFLNKPGRPKVPREAHEYYEALLQGKANPELLPQLTPHRKKANTYQVFPHFHPEPIR